jgi:hypothetical protein
MLYYHVEGPGRLVSYFTEHARAVATARFYLRADYAVRTWVSYAPEGRRSKVACPTCGQVA